MSVVPFNYSSRATKVRGLLTVWAMEVGSSRLGGRVMCNVDDLQGGIVERRPCRPPCTHPSTDSDVELQLSMSLFAPVCRSEAAVRIRHTTLCSCNFNIAHGSVDCLHQVTTALTCHRVILPAMSAGISEQIYKYSRYSAIVSTLPNCTRSTLSAVFDASHNGFLGHD